MLCRTAQESETKVDKVVEERSDECQFSGFLCVLHDLKLVPSLAGSEDSGDAPDEPPVPPRKVTSHSKESKTNKKRDDEEGGLMKAFTNEIPSN